jgi:O-acetyl-ADP-ribose deacetylase (regulator of RNase III)
VSEDFEKAMIIKVIYGNIVAQPDAEAVINSANTNLRFGSGVVGACLMSACVRQIGVVLALRTFEQQQSAGKVL